MHKKILAALLLGAMLATASGCHGAEGEEKQSVSVQENTDDAEEKARAKANEEEQEAGAAQVEADAIDQQHVKEEIPAESVEQTVFAQSILQLDESANWIRVRSENREDGSFGEKYACEEGLEYEWNYTPSEKADAAGGLEAALAQPGWSVSDTSRNDELSDRLGCEVYNYTVYEDDNGYSMIRQGLYFDMEGGYYTADFSMMEGNMGMYYEKAETLLAQVYIL